ncbi:hypothetical protein [Aquitalea sp.]|uniref:hypothetical protein n=1 Tax=Aquitalea sp. TaxID=1872623 RepID=UPI0025827E2A|nr:hypothetical protein [Aquitalea sp.]
MSDLLDTTAVRDWADDAIRRHSKGVFGKLVPAVIWSDTRGDDGELLVPIDPVELVARINKTPHILLHNHDPGRPKGQVLESASFVAEGGKKFIAAVMGYYVGGEVLNFQGLGLDTKVLVPSPGMLPALPADAWIQFATDPREVEVAWLEQVISNAPLRVEYTELSHNAAESAQELIRLSLVYLAIVWNPFITSIASEAGKNTYAAIHGWVRKLLSKLAERRNPVLDIHTHQDDCQVSFLFRGKDVKQHYAAHDALPVAAVQAAKLIMNLKARGMIGRQLIYEFDKEALLWFPSYAVLNDNRIITDNVALIAIEKLPTGLSLGLSRDKLFSPQRGKKRENDSVK